jgi:SAM-dependent methyltransferase
MSLAAWARRWVDLEQASLERAIAAAAPRARGRMLDVGCGDKPYEAAFKPFVAEHVGVDFAPTFEGSENAKRNRADKLYSGDVLPFEDSEFDTVLCTQVLEHTPTPERLLAECARVLKSGGILILTAPFSFRVHSEPHDYFRYTKYGLASLLGNRGLAVKTLEPRGGFWWVVGQKVASHLALRAGRLGASLQEAGGLTYEPPQQVRPRTWALPLVVPMILVVVAAARFLEWINPEPTDTLGYWVVAEKPADAAGTESRDGAT